MKRVFTTITAALLLMACEGEPKGQAQDSAGKKPDPTTDDTDSNTSVDSETVDPPVLTEGPDPTEAATETEADDTCSFVCDTTSEPEIAPECDNWTQDCPDDQKCAAYADDGGSSWNNLKCVPFDPGGGQPGDPCSVEGDGVSGFDSCAKGSMCWDTDENNKGTCVELCTGSPDAPQCSDTNTTCVIANEGVLNLCLGKCDPLLQDCTGNNLCLPNPVDPNGFVCVLDASGPNGAAFDVCEYANACDKGLVCYNPGLATECDAAAKGCCLPFCDLGEPDCPGAGQECLPWYEEGAAPPGYESLGLCGLPG